MHMSASLFNSCIDFKSLRLSLSSPQNFISPPQNMIEYSLLHVSRLTVQGCSPLKSAKRWTREDPHVEFDLFLAHPVHFAGPGHTQPPAPTYPDKDHERGKAEQKAYHKRWWSLQPTDASFSGVNT